MSEMRACCLNLLQSVGATVVVVVGRGHIKVPFWRAAAQDGRSVMAITATRDFLTAQSAGMLERHVEVQLAAGRKRGDPGETVLVKGLSKCCGYSRHCSASPAIPFAQVKRKCSVVASERPAPERALATWYSELVCGSI